MYDINSNIKSASSKNCDNDTVRNEGIDPSTGLRNCSGSKSQTQGQVPPSTNNSNCNNNANAHLVQHFFSILNSSLDAKRNSMIEPKMALPINNASTSSSVVNTINNMNEKVTNVAVNNNIINTAISNCDIPGNLNGNLPLNYPLNNIKQNWRGHLPYDAASAALLMNPQATVRAAVTAQAAVASVSHQFSAAPVPQVIMQSRKQSPQPHQRFSQQNNVHGNNTNLSGDSKTHKSKGVEMSSPLSYYPRSELNHNRRNPVPVPVNDSSNILSQENNNNINANMNANNSIGVNQALAILSSAGLINNNPNLNPSLAHALNPKNESAVNGGSSSVTRLLNPSMSPQKKLVEANNNGIGVKRALAILSSVGLMNHSNSNQNNASQSIVNPPTANETISSMSSPQNNHDRSKMNVISQHVVINQALNVLSPTGLVNNSNLNQAVAGTAAAMKMPHFQHHGRIQHNGAINTTTTIPNHPQSCAATSNHNQPHNQMSHSIVSSVRPNDNNHGKNKNKRHVRERIMSSIASSTMSPPSKIRMKIPPIMNNMPPTLQPIAPPKPFITPPIPMKNWTLNQLEVHARLLQEANQPISQYMSSLLVEARRKEEKRTAKRVANRKSACTSRARKKALVEEMTRMNTKLRRQALILSLLPDLVMAITVEGEITFCSAQVERFLRYNPDDLIGSNIMDIILPNSKDALQNHIKNLLRAEVNKLNSRTVAKTGHNVSSSSSSELSNDAAIVSEQSFPLSVVKVMGQEKISSTAQSIDNTNGSGENGKNSQSNSSLGNSSSQSGSDEDRVVRNRNNKNNDRRDDAYFTEAKMRASESLNRNVQIHKEKLCKDTQGCSTKHKDDVTGASVTSNNAGARLSSLQHCPESGNAPIKVVEKNETKKTPMSYESLEAQSSSSASSETPLGEEEKNTRKPGVAAQQSAQAPNENESDDSGYRVGSESPPSREDSGSSVDDNSSNHLNGRRSKPLTSMCNICLIRDDLTTLWCEVTSSIKTQLSDDEVKGCPSPKPAVSGSSSTYSTTTENKPESEVQQDKVKELLLCLRPIREGDEKASAKLQFTPKTNSVSSVNNVEMKSIEKMNKQSDTVNDKKIIPSPSHDTKSISTVVELVPQVKRPMKKRPLARINTTEIQSTVEKRLTQNTTPFVETNGQSLTSEVTTEKEQSVVESLILMSHKKQRIGK